MLPAWTGNFPFFPILTLTSLSKKVIVDTTTKETKNFNSIEISKIFL